MQPSCSTACTEKPMAAGNLHVVMLPWSAFGHLLPFFELSMALAKTGVHVSFISTPRNIQRLPPLPPNLNPFIHFVSFPLPSSETALLPAGAEATVDLPFEKINYLKSSYDNLRDPIEKFVSDQCPNYLILDIVPYWAVEIGRAHHVQVIFFSTFSASTCTFLGPQENVSGDGMRRVRPSPESFTQPPEWVTFDSSVAFKKHEATTVFSGLYESNGTDVTDADRGAAILRGCDAVAIRSCNEYEGHYLNLLAKILGKPVIPTGLLPPENTRNEAGDIFEWLEKQKAKSVVYVGFGSECKLTREQTYEIAYGVELSELPFLWVLRNPEWAVEAMDALPQGFRERTSDRGMVRMGWAPQREILANPAIGGTLFQGGWGSVIEMLQFGHCLVVLPFIIDQPLNARFLVEKGLGVEVERREDGSFTRKDVSDALRRAMASVELRANAGEAALVFGDKKLHDQYIHSFVEYLKSRASKHDN